MTTTSQPLATMAHDPSPERVHAAHARRQLARVGLNAASIERFLRTIVDTDLHAKMVLSLSLGTLGVLHAASLCIHVSDARWRGRGGLTLSTQSSSSIDC